MAEINSPSGKILPWQKDQWQQLQDAILQGRLPHALMLAGIPGIGKADFARQLIMGIHCDNTHNGMACGQCPSCSQIQHEIHPDVISVTVEEGKTQISIEQIRALQTFIQLSQSSNKPKMVIINPADAMNINSANSLLKTLEEPQGSSLLILVANQPAHLPATIRSRCQLIALNKPDPQQSKAWLEQAGCEQPERWLTMSQGAPFRALDLSGSIDISEYSGVIDSCLGLVSQQITETVKLESVWGKIPLELLFEWQYSLVRDLIRAKKSVQKAHFENQDRFEQLRVTSKQLDYKRIFRLYETLLQLGKMLHANLKPELYRERMILAWKLID